MRTCSVLRQFHPLWMAAFCKVASVLAMLVFQMSLPGMAQAQSPGAGSLRDEISRQDSIFQSKGDQVPGGYSIDRTLADYVLGLSNEFDRELAGLSAKDRWLDIGAGEGRAILDYHAPNNGATRPLENSDGSKASSVAISIEDRRTPAWHKRTADLGANKIQYLFGKRFGQYDREELGKFQLISDVLGGFSYTDNLSRFMERVLGVLETNGSFYTVLQDVGAANEANRPYYPDSRFLTEITNADGADLKVCSWLKSISCVQVTCELRQDWKPPIERYRVRKVCDNVSVPELAPVSYEAGTPPERRFQVRKLPPDPVKDSGGGAR